MYQAQKKKKSRPKKNRSIRGVLVITEVSGHTGREGLRFSGGDFVDFASFVDVAALHHLKLQVTGHLCDEEHADQLT